MRDSSELLLNAVPAFTTVNSGAVNVTQCFAASFQSVATVDGAGTVKVQFSNDPAGLNSPAPTNWSDIASATMAISGSSGVVGLAKIDLCYNWVRVVFTASGGTTGALSVRMK